MSALWVNKNTLKWKRARKGEYFCIAWLFSCIAEVKVKRRQVNQATQLAEKAQKAAFCLSVSEFALTF